MATLRLRRGSFRPFVLHEAAAKSRRKRQDGTAGDGDEVEQEGVHVRKLYAGRAKSVRELPPTPRFVLAPPAIPKAASARCRFEKVESEEMGEGAHERYLALANRLADHFGVPRASTPDQGHSCCH
jgi:hypothetical protein